MARFSDLEDVLAHVWAVLEQAANDPGHALRRPTFGTVRAGRPKLRTVVLRETEPEERRLSFHTDHRAKKVEEVRTSDQIAWHGWDPESRQQFRLHGSATVHRDDVVAKDLWAAEDPEALIHYVRPRAPGAPLEESGDGLPPQVRSGSVSREDVAGGQRHFAVIRTVIDSIDWLHLHPDGHYRALLQFLPDEQRFEGRWVVP